MDSECIIEEERKVAGLKQVIRGISDNRIKKIYLATDCDAVIENKITPLAEGKVTIIKKYTRKQLGKACDLNVGAAVVGIYEND